MMNGSNMDGLDRETFASEWDRIKSEQDTVNLGKSANNMYGYNQPYYNNQQYQQGSMTVDKVLAALSYMGILWIVPLLMRDRSRYVVEHLNNALNIWLSSMVVSVCYAIVAFLIAIPIAIAGEALSESVALIILGIFTLTISLGVVIYAIILSISNVWGFINACIGKMPVRWIWKNTNIAS